MEIKYTLTQGLNNNHQRQAEESKTDLKKPNQVQSMKNLEPGIYGEDNRRERVVQEQPSSRDEQDSLKTFGPSMLSLPEKIPEPYLVETKSKINWSSQ